jgi:cephalosporin hydroxylase
MQKYRSDGILPLVKSGIRLFLSTAGLRGRDVITSPETEEEVVKEFHKLYYYDTESGDTWRSTYWMGTEILKCPTDLFVYQEIIYDVQPDIIVEAGTHKGGSALYLSDVCDIIGDTQIITIDITTHEDRPKKDNINYITGSSTDEDVVDEVASYIDDSDKVLVILDSDHSKEHVLEEMNIYSEFVTEGSYLIVEDTNLSGNPVAPNYGPGPMEAVEEFMIEDNNFEVDDRREKFYMTFNPGGFLKKSE